MVATLLGALLLARTRHGLDLEALAAAAAAVEGRHDFTAFTPTETEHVFFERRVLRCSWRRAAGASSGGLGGPGHSGGGGPACLEIEADSFLRHMVRALVGTMVEVGEGTRDLEDLRLLLRGASREAAGFTAPPQGLFLWDVSYGSGWCDQCVGGHRRYAADAAQTRGA